MSSSGALQLIDPCTACATATPGSDAQALALLERMCGRDPRAWSRELRALYHAEDPESAAVARALADRLWLRVQGLLAPHLPATYWAGALEQLGRQHAGGAVIVVAPHAVFAPVAQALLTLARAREVVTLAPGLVRITLEAEVAAAMQRAPSGAAP